MRKRVAIVSSSCPPIGAGGVSSAHYNLYLALKCRGHDARMFTFGDYGVRSDNHEITRAGPPRWFENLVRLATGVFFRLADRGKVAYHFAEVLSSLWPCAKLRGAINQFRPDVLVLSDHGCPGLVIGKPRNCRIILISHHNPARFLHNPLWKLHSELDCQLTVWCENRVLRKVDVAVCPSHYMKEEFGKTYAYTGAVAVIPNLMDHGLLANTPAHNPRPSLGLSENSVLVYIPSAGSGYKGSRFVFEIIRRLSARCPGDIGFYLSGELNPELLFELRYVPSNAKVYAPGQIGYGENLAIVKSCSFGVSPTLAENYSMALLEAGACGVPMVSFDVGGNSEVICHGTSGVIIPYLDLEALIQAASRLLDVKVLQGLRRTTLDYAMGQHRTESVVAEFERLMNDSGTQG